MVIPELYPQSKGNIETEVNCLKCNSNEHKNKLYDYVTGELDYVISENQPVIKGRQSVLSVGENATLALKCVLNNPRNYNSLSFFLSDQSNSVKDILVEEVDRESLQRNLSNHLSILID